MKGRARDALRALLALAAALLLGGLALAALGRDPVEFYARVVNRALLGPTGWQEVLVQMAPLLLVAASLIVAFRAGLWNLGVDGQLLLAAVVVAALAPRLVTVMPYPLAIGLLMIAGGAVGAAWAALPAWLRAAHGVNEIVSTLMMSFLAASLSALLIKTALGDPENAVPQTLVLAVEDRLPRLGGTLVHLGVVLALFVLVAVHLLMTRTAFGLRLRIAGTSPRAARHAGLDLRRLTFATFGLSAALAGLAGALEVLGVRGVVRADWHPGYGLLVVPVVFLARLNGIAAIPFIAAFAVLSIGGESAARRADLPNHVLLVIVALVLGLLALVDHLAARRAARRGQA